MTRLAAAVTAVRSSAQPQSWAVGLYVTQSLTVVALLGLSRPRERALVRLVSGLLAVVAKAFCGGTDLRIVADIAALVTGTTSKRRHLET